MDTDIVEMESSPSPPLQERFGTARVEHLTFEVRLSQQKLHIIQMIARGLTRLTRSFTGSAFTQIIGQNSLRNSAPEDYRKLRELSCSFERSGLLGSDIELTDDEVEVNHVVMALKMAEYNRGVDDPAQFVPSHHIFQRLHKIKESPLFRLLNKMPKGGSLKVYVTSMGSMEYLIRLTYMEHLWVCTTEQGCRIRTLRFSKHKPSKIDVKDGFWQTMAELREKRGAGRVDEQLRMEFGMLPFVENTTSAAAWSRMQEIYQLVSGLLRYAPAFADYLYNSIAEFYADGAQYLEVRAMLQRFYSLDGSKLTVQDTVKVYQEQVKRFKRDHPDFIDVRIIYSPLRNSTIDEMGKYVKLCSELNEEFPDLVIGFDLVGREDGGEPLVKFVSELRKLPPHINLYLHAGQTNWNGTHVDENLIDAVLLGAKRIGHAYALIKHPLVMQLVKNLGIAIELSPISNQVLQLGADYRNHPAATLIANNVPCVISSGSPSFWRTKPLSHDFYMLFLGIAPTHSDLKLLKRISKNSIKFSSLPAKEKSLAMKKWVAKWDQWIEFVAQNKHEFMVEQ